MVNETIVKICAERIMAGGLNPKTGLVYVLTDVVNEDYRLAITDYIVEQALVVV
jgi:hypothetical protein